MPTFDLDGIAAYYEQHGDGEPLLLLHGGFCSLETMEAQLRHLATTYRVHAMERPGHGRTADRPGPFTYQAMVEDTLAFLEAVDVESTHVVGFSDGAVVGLLLALDHPARVRSLVAISANLDPSVFGDAGDEDEAGTDGDAGDDPERAVYDRLTPDGPAHGDVVLAKLLALWQVEPRIDAADLARVSAPTLVLAGDRDVIPTHHTVDIAQAIPGAQLCILPGAGHLAVREQPAAVNAAISAFMASIRG